MKVILSIKPIYAEKILNGEKIYELRKTIFKNPNIKKVVIYASYPISKVIGEFEIEDIIHEDLKNLWLKTKDHSYVNKTFFNEYFENRKMGYAIKIKSTKKYKKLLDIKESFGIRAPQSFAYIY